MTVVVNCWFCNANSRVPASQSNSWHCHRCDQYNGFTADGDYNVDVSTRHASENARHHVRYNAAVTRGDTASPSLQLCSSCTQQQALKVRLLADFEPESADSADVELAEYRRRLERTHVLCAECAAKVAYTVAEQDRVLLPAVAAWRAGQVMPSSSSSPALSTPSSSSTAVPDKKVQRSPGRLVAVLAMVVRSVLLLLLAIMATSSSDESGLCFTLASALSVSVQLPFSLLLCDPSWQLRGVVVLLGAHAGLHVLSGGSVVGGRGWVRSGARFCLWLQVCALVWASYCDLVSAAQAARSQLLLLLLLQFGETVSFKKRSGRKSRLGHFPRVPDLNHVSNNVSLTPLHSTVSANGASRGVPNFGPSMGSTPKLAPLSVSTQCCESVATSALTSLSLNGVSSAFRHQGGGVGSSMFSMRQYSAPPASPLLTPSRLTAAGPFSPAPAPGSWSSCEMEVSPVCRAPSRQSSGFGDWHTPTPDNDALSQCSDACHRGSRLESSCGGGGVGGLSQCSAWSRDSTVIRAADSNRAALVGLLFGFSLAFNVFLLFFSVGR